MCIIWKFLDNGDGSNTTHYGENGIVAGLSPGFKAAWPSGSKMIIHSTPVPGGGYVPGGFSFEVRNLSGNGFNVGGTYGPNGGGSYNGFLATVTQGGTTLDKTDLLFDEKLGSELRDFVVGLFS